MLHRQRGITLIGALLTGIAIVLVLILGMRVAPVYSEYMAVKKVLNRLSTEPAQNSDDIRRGFERQADISEISSFKSSDLIITKVDKRFTVSVQWERRVAIGGNVALVFSFSVDTATGSEGASAQ